MRELTIDLLLEQIEGNAFIEMEQEIARLRNRNEKLEHVLESTKTFIENIEPSSHEHNRLWLILMADIALAEQEEETK